VRTTYIMRAAESTVASGGQSTGLDRFGRVVDQRGLVASTGTGSGLYF